MNVKKCTRDTMYWSFLLTFLASPFFSKTQLAFVSTCLSEIRVPKQLPTASILTFLEVPTFSKFLSLYSITWDFSHFLKNSIGGFDLISGNMNKNKIQSITRFFLWIIIDIIFQRCTPLNHFFLDSIFEPLYFLKSCSIFDELTFLVGIF